MTTPVSSTRDRMDAPAGPPMTIRRVRPEDREALDRLLHRIENFTPEEVAVALELVDGAIRDPRGSGYEVLVAQEGDGPLLGYVCYGPTPLTDGTFDLYWIAVDPDCRGRGAGRFLHDAMLADLRGRGARLVRLETSSQDSYDGTLRFYEALGYEVVSRVGDFYRPGDDLVTLFLRL